MENPEFLKKKYDLHNSPEVESAARKTERQSEEKLPNDAALRIQNYLDRLKSIINPPKLEGHANFDRRERNLEMLKRSLYDNFVIKSEEIPEGYFENQRRIAREQGHGDIEITDEARRQLTEVIITDQQSSLDNWVDYLASEDAAYPDWLKYYAFRGVLGMGEYNKKEKRFAKRSKTTTKPFSDINREALAYVLDAISQKYGKQHINLLALNEEEKKEFGKLLQGENFAKLYAWAIEKLIIEPTESLEKTAGKWAKYSRNSNHMPLVESLRGHGTGWCTAGESTAEIQLKGGDFYVFYSLDQKGKPTIPRVAIRTQENNIAEIRGIAAEQNLDPYIGDVVQEKLKDFPDGKAYEKKVNDMKFLTAIENKIKNKQKLTKDDLIFLYELNFPIEGFGYRRDPRISEFRKTRNSYEDMFIIFSCESNQIAHSLKEINTNTKAFVGKLEPGIFYLIQKYNIEHVYTSFPEGKIRREDLEIGGLDYGKFFKELNDNGIQIDFNDWKNVRDILPSILRMEKFTAKIGKDTIQFLEELVSKQINISDYAQDMLKSKDFAYLKKSEGVQLIRISVADLGFDRGATTDQVYGRAQSLGLELCPAEVGPHYRLKYIDQPLNEWFWIAMKQITDRNGNPGVFNLERNEDGLWLNNNWAKPENRWNSDYKFVFRLRKLKS